MIVIILSIGQINAQGFLNKLKSKLGDDKISYNYNKTPDGAVVIDSIVENINLSAFAIKEAAKEYLEKSYKESKYKITNDDNTKNSVSGQGQFLHFCDGKVGIVQYYFTTSFVVQVDAKDGRMRVSIIADKYSGEKIDMNNTEEIDEKISDYMPVNPNNTSKQSLYSKAFAVLYEKMNIVKQELTDYVLSKVTATIDNDNW